MRTNAYTTVLEVVAAELMLDADEVFELTESFDWADILADVSRVIVRVEGGLFIEGGGTR